MYSEIKTKGITITIFGSRKDQEKAYDTINTKHINRITGDEKKDRLYIMNLILNLKLKASILYEGNTIYDNNKILKNLRGIKRQGDKACDEYGISEGMKKLTPYTYQWLTNACGSIAHYNKIGWINEYPTVSALRDFFHYNEFGNNIYDYIPAYNTSNKALALEVLKIYK